MSRWLGFLLMLVTSSVSWMVYHWFAARCGASDPNWIATLLLVSVMVHEFGHWAVMERHGFKAHVIVLVLLGGAFPDKTPFLQYKQLPWVVKAEISLAGVIGNLAVMLVVLMMGWFGWLSGYQTSQAVYLNAGLILTNLLPFGILDGGRFAKVLFDSIPEHRDFNYFAAIARVVLLVTVGIAFIWNQFFPVIVGLLLVGTYRQLQHDDPQGSTNRLAMTTGQCQGWTAVYLVMVTISLIALAVVGRVKLFS